LLYFPSGTTARPKLVAHTQASYPIGHLSTMYWLGLKPGDVHLNLSSPGWAKHAWSSLFAPWNAAATVLAYHYERFDARALLGQLARCRVSEEGEICIDLAQRPLGLMQGYLDDPARNASAMGDGYYHTGDVASRDADGYLTYVGRMDDVFKSSDYRVSPFELESVLIEHPAVAEAAVVPSPDALRLSVPKAFVVL